MSVLMLGVLAACGTAPSTSPFEYYGWFYVLDYIGPTGDLRRIRTYTNTGFAVLPLQAKTLKELGFEHIVYSTAFENQAVLDQLAGESPGPIPSAWGYSDYAGAIPNYREKFFPLYRTKLAELKASLAGSLGAIDVFYVADEPAANRQIYPDQAFLDQLVTEFKQVFPGKKTMMAFAQYPGPITPEQAEEFFWLGNHFSPPPALDIVGVNPFIDTKEVSCETESIRSWIYERNPYTNINWAKQFKKPIIVVGDAQIRDGKTLDHCYPRATFDILKVDKDVTGLIWYQYDKSYREISGVDGTVITGAANDPEFVRLIENLGRKSRKK